MVVPLRVMSKLIPPGADRRRSISELHDSVVGDPEALPNLFGKGTKQGKVICNLEILVTQTTGSIVRKPSGSAFPPSSFCSCTQTYAFCAFYRNMVPL
jgi:hypothetical protein